MYNFIKIKMFAVVQYNNKRKEVKMEMKCVTRDIEEAKRIAFDYAKKSLLEEKNINKNSNEVFKITTNENYDCHVDILNRIIVEYRVISVSHWGKSDWKIEYSLPDIHTVIEIPEKEETNTNANTTIDDKTSSLICNDYYPYYYDSDEEHYDKYNLFCL